MCPDMPIPRYRSTWTSWVAVLLALTMPWEQLTFGWQVVRSDPPEHAQGPVGTAALIGRVQSSAGEPLAGVRVTALAAEYGTKAWRTDTGVDGRFALQQLPKGTFTVRIYHAQYLLDEADPAAARLAQPIRLADGQTFRTTLRMLRGGVITGRLTDPSGRPIPDVLVRAFDIPGNDTDPLRPAPARAYRSNDLGAYRIANLLPGQYLVAATSPGPSRPSGADSAMSFAPSWHPGTERQAEAAEVTVEAEAECAGVDISLRAVALRTLTGRVFDMQGIPADGVEVRAYPADGSRLLGSAPTGRSLRSGGFTIRGLGPGEYRLRATRAPGTRVSIGASTASTLQYAEALVAVPSAGDVPPISLELAPAPSLVGTVRVEAPIPASTRPLRIQAIAPALGQQREALATVSPAGTSTFDLPVLPGSYFLSVSGLPPGWVLRQIVVGGADVSDRPIAIGPGSTRVELWISPLGATLTWTIQGSRDQAVDVLLFRENETTWHRQLDGVVLLTSTDPARSSAGGLRPGAYMVAAVTGFDRRRQNDVRLLRRLKLIAQRVDLAPGETRSLTLTVHSLPR